MLGFLPFPSEMSTFAATARWSPLGMIFRLPAVTPQDVDSKDIRTFRALNRGRPFDVVTPTAREMNSSSTLNSSFTKNSEL